MGAAGLGRDPICVVLADWRDTGRGIRGDAHVMRSALVAGATAGALLAVGAWLAVVGILARDAIAVSVGLVVLAAGTWVADRIEVKG